MTTLRRRSVLERLGLALCVTLVALLLVSLEWSVIWEGRSLTLAVRQGSVYFWWSPGGAADGWSILPSWRYRDWWLDFISLRAGARHGWLPLWIPLLLAVGGTAWLAWRRRHCFPPGTCQNCGYDLTGNVSGRCPECGAAA